ncbi:hypothetical protein PPYR_02626 [Photinus pyralis]|uniref:Peptidase A2 domain-containing protein n=1 Tax=Photinus pyralis TaxID=7054 RepID=A0A5N4AT66_PHOPY|nr:hypothetical protein PPYR_06302 [Photinus pyralis]KAB0805656.1 hypothetical protein PPYR_02626 [Photinus pyralis]
MIDVGPMSSRRFQEANRVKCLLDFVFSHVQGDERPHIRVNILGKEMLGLLDSGATRSVIGERGCKILRSTGLPLLKSEFSNITVANGQVCACVGILRVPIKLKETVKVIDLLVVPTLGQLLILGVDFWTQMGIVPNLRAKEWKFAAEGEVEVNSLDPVNSRQNLNLDQERRLSEAIECYFGHMPTSFSCTDLVEHKIELLDNVEPIKQRYYPVSPALLKES